MTETAAHDWITVHQMRFQERISSLERTFPPIAGPDCWIFGPHYDIGPDGMVSGVNDEWAGMGIWKSREAAEAAVNAPGEVIPWLGEAVTSWHCLAIPFAHRGTVNWRGQLQTGDTVHPAPADPGGPLAILTSAGFTSRDAAAMPRIKRFVAGVVEVLGYYGAHPANLRRGAFRAGFDGRDGFTFTLWRADEGMQKAAYHPGVHRTLLNQDNAGELSDRSSFTRLRVLKCWGDWDGEVSWT